KDLDLISVVVRVPLHRDLVMKALQAGKAVYCEWPLGNGLKEAQEMADLARKKALPNMSGLQSRSDPTIRYARELIDQDYVGEVLLANLKIIAGAQLERGPGRIWQGIRSNGANPLTIPGGLAWIRWPIFWASSPRYRRASPRALPSGATRRRAKP
ncbi:MAG: Gfo/Idh/MocA family oxidoreductase, partial [Pseudomonadota bacterium]